MGRGIKILVPCCMCKKHRYHTSFHPRARGFVCRKDFEFLEKNPSYSNRPFKGWGFWPKKGEEGAPA